MVKKKTGALKNSLYPHGLRAVGQLSALIPPIIGQIIITWILSKATMVFSNVPGPKNGLNYKGVHMHGFIALVPGNGDLAFGMTGDRKSVV